MSYKEQATFIQLNGICPGFVWDLSITNLHCFLHQHGFHTLYFGFSLLLSLKSTILVSLPHEQIELMQWHFFMEFIWNLEKVRYVNLCHFFYEASALFGVVHCNWLSLPKTVKRICS